uniref:Uncharacterized protein n=1 Tax=Rhipicephalus microplus TaxID=6941 RepID=A0A6G5AFW0_RHIMP
MVTFPLHAPHNVGLQEMWDLPNFFICMYTLSFGHAQDHATGPAGLQRIQRETRQTVFSAQVQRFGNKSCKGNPLHSTGFYSQHVARLTGVKATLPAKQQESVKSINFLIICIPSL